MIGELCLWSEKPTQTQYTNEPHTNTHVDLHLWTPQELTSPLRDYLCHHSTCILSHSLSPCLPLSHSHLCLAVGHKVGLCGEEVLAVAVASGAVELVRLQHGTLRPLVPVGLSPAHRLSPVPALQPQPHRMPSRNCVGTVRQWAAHCCWAVANGGLGGPGDAQGCATWHGPRHVCQGGSPKSWRLATVAVKMSVRAVGSVTMAAFEFLAVWLESPSSCTG